MDHPFGPECPNILHFLRPTSPNRSIDPVTTIPTHAKVDIIWPDESAKVLVLQVGPLLQY